MLTKIDLCSMALLKLGESPIQSLTDDSAAAKLSRTLFDTIVNSLLSLHPWRFATQQIDLVKNTDNDFLIPSDVLRVLKTDGKIIGTKVISNSDTTSIVAIIKTPPEKFPVIFHHWSQRVWRWNFVCHCWAIKLCSVCWLRYMNQNYKTQNLSTVRPQLMIL